MPSDVELQAPEAVVEVFCLQARNLPEVESGTSFYCVIETTSSEQMYKTHIVPSSLHPVWNESYQVKISIPSQQMMTVKIMAEREGKHHDEFVGVIVVPVSRIMAGENHREGGWYEIRGEKSNVVVGPDGLSKVELFFCGSRATPGLKPTTGWLTMRGPSNVWKRNFFMLDPYNQMLRYFADPDAMTQPAPNALGEFNTRCCEVEELLVDQPSPNMFKVKTFFAGLLLYADTPEDRNIWVDVLQKVGNPPGIRVLPAPPTSGRQATSLSPPTSSKDSAVRNAPPSPPQQEQPLQGQPPAKQPAQPAASIAAPQARVLGRPEACFAGLEVTRQPPHAVVAVDDLVDPNFVPQGKPGYSNPVVRVGDRILAVSGRPAEHVPVQELHEMLRGPLHSELELTLASKSTNDVYTIRVLRHRYHEIDSANARASSPGIAQEVGGKPLQRAAGYHSPEAAKPQPPPVAPNTTGPASSPQSPPQTSDSYAQLQRKFEATRRALADHVAKCRDLEGQLSEARSARTSDPQMEAENATLKELVARLQFELEKEKRAVADLESISQGSSGQRAAEIQLLKEALEAKERELVQSQHLLHKKDLEIQEKLDEMAASAAGRKSNARLESVGNVQDQEIISMLNVENKLLKEALEKIKAQHPAADGLQAAKLEGEIMILKENLQQERKAVLEMAEKMTQAHEKEMHAQQRLHDLQSFGRDHDYWPQVLQKKDEEITQLRGQVLVLSGENRNLISDNLEMKTRFEQSRAAILNQMTQEKGKASHHEIELKKRIEEIEKRAIAAGEGYHSSLEALDAERSELRRDLLEAQHALSEAKKKVLQEHQERIKLEAEMEGVRKSSKSEQELKQQVTTLQAQLLQLQNEIKIEGKKQLPTSQVAARELIADITSTLSVRSSRVAQSTSALSQQNGHRTLATFNLNAVQTDDELGDDPYLM